MKYEKADGTYASGWCRIGGNKYYFNSDGVLRTGWLKTSGGKKYYITKSKGCLTGWQIISGKQYYFNSDGVMKTGWIKTKSGRRYFMDENGVMVTEENYPDGIVINGKLYKFDILGMWDGNASEGSSDKKSIYEQRREAYNAVKACNAEYDKYCELKEAEFKKRDAFYDYAEFLEGFMDVNNDCKALVPYSQLTLDEVRKINNIVSEICVHTGENDSAYWNKQNDDDFYYRIYEQCNKIARQYNFNGTSYNDEIEEVIKKRNSYAELYNSLDKMIKALDK